MNDLLFLLLVENLRPGESAAWFCVMPRRMRDSICEATARQCEINPQTAAFAIARLISLTVWLAAMAWLISRMSAGSIEDLLRVSFLALALFWALSPTLNPWYWSWALPLVAFARSKGWLLVSGLLVLYYVRFTFLYHADDPILRSFPYQGTDTFDYLVVFVEHVPWMLVVSFHCWPATSQFRGDHT